MNIYVSDDLKKKWCNYEFVGHSFNLGNKKYIWAKFKDRELFRNKHLYSFDDDWFWHDPDLNYLKKQ